MDIRAVGEKICNSFVLFDEELPTERREQLSGYLNLLTQHVSMTKENSEKHSLMANRSGNSANKSSCQHVLINSEDGWRNFDGNSATVMNFSNEVVQQKRNSSTCSLEQLEPDTKRRRMLIDSGNDYELFDHGDHAISTVTDSTVAQLTGNFSVAMDLWTDESDLNLQSTTNDMSASDLFLVEVTDEEMNKFWDTLPKEFGGLM